jgi:hypothetical protein
MSDFLEISLHFSGADERRLVVTAHGSGYDSALKVLHELSQRSGAKP